MSAMGSQMAVDAPAGPCIPGQLRLFVNADGNFYPCERVSEQSEMMCIGNLDNGFDVEKARALLQVSRITEKQCRECWCFRFCDQCARKADMGEEALSAEKKLLACKETRADAERKIYEYLLLREAPLYYKEQIRMQKGAAHVAE